MNRKRVQVALTLMPGAEPWVRVTHDRGFFKLPGDAQVLELLNGALEHWSSTTRRLIPAERYVRVPLSLWHAAQLPATPEELARVRGLR